MQIVTLYSSFEDGRWHEFNDSTVKEITKDTMKLAYGGKNKGTTLSSASAYMLLYRRVSPANESTSIHKIYIQIAHCLDFMSDGDLPGPMRDIQTAELVEEVKAQAEDDEKKANIKIDAYYFDPKNKLVTVTLPVQTNVNKKVSDLLNGLYRGFKMDERKISIEDCRLRKVAHAQGLLYHVLDPSLTLKEAGISTNWDDVLLETKLEDGSFFDYPPNCMINRGHMVQDGKIGTT